LEHHLLLQQRTHIAPLQLPPSSSHVHSKGRVGCCCCHRRPPSRPPPHAAELHGRHQRAPASAAAAAGVRGRHPPQPPQPQVCGRLSHPGWVHFDPHCTSNPLAAAATICAAMAPHQLKEAMAQKHSHQVVCTWLETYSTVGMYAANLLERDILTRTRFYTHTHIHYSHSHTNTRIRAPGRATWCTRAWCARRATWSPSCRAWTRWGRPRAWGR